MTRSGFTDSIARRIPSAAFLRPIPVIQIWQEFAERRGMKNFASSFTAKQISRSTGFFARRPTGPFPLSLVDMTRLSYRREAFFPNFVEQHGGVDVAQTILGDFAKTFFGEQ